jgi:hypothetical protein
MRLNARSHGLFARDVALPEEDADAFEDLFKRLRPCPANPFKSKPSTRADRPRAYLARDHRARRQVEPRASRMG